MENLSEDIITKASKIVMSLWQSESQSYVNRQQVESVLPLKTEVFWIMKPCGFVTVLKCIT